MQLVKISAIWCPACLVMRPRLEEISKKFPNIEQIEYDYDLDEEIVNKYNVGTKLPVFILLDNDRELTRIIGEKTINELTNILEEYK